jgi:transcriptional regulator with XRE-family HTH domain
MRKTIFEPAYRDLVATLRAARLQQGLRQEDVATKLGVTRTWVAKVEGHEIRLDVVQLVRLARIVGLRAHRLVKAVEGAVP